MNNIDNIHDDRIWKLLQVMNDKCTEFGQEFAELNAQYKLVVRDPQVTLKALYEHPELVHDDSLSSLQEDICSKTFPRPAWAEDEIFGCFQIKIPGMPQGAFAQMAQVQFTEMSFVVNEQTPRHGKAVYTNLFLYYRQLTSSADVPAGSDLEDLRLVFTGCHNRPVSIGLSPRTINQVSFVLRKWAEYYPVFYKEKYLKWWGTSEAMIQAKTEPTTVDLHVETAARCSNVLGMLNDVHDAHAAQAANL